MRAIDISYRALRSEDFDDVMAIEEASFPDAWTQPVMRTYVDHPRALVRVGLIDNRLVAFCVLMVDGGSMHLANLAVHPSKRRLGLGLSTVRHVLTFAEGMGLRDVHLEVRESNLPAQLLYRKAGFRAERILRSYYKDEDGYEMRRSVFPNTTQPSRASS